jgi:hypothetical protein
VERPIDAVNFVQHDEDRREAISPIPQQPPQQVVVVRAEAKPLEQAKPLEEPKSLPMPAPERIQNQEPNELPPVVVKPPPQRKTTSEADHLRDLAEAPEIGLGATAQSVLTSYVVKFQQDVQVRGTPLLADPTPMIRLRSDLRTLPLHAGAACQLNVKEAATLDTLSRKLRVYLNAAAALDGTPRSEAMVKLLREALLSERRGARPEWCGRKRFRL